MSMIVPKGRIFSFKKIPYRETQVAGHAVILRITIRYKN